MKIWILEIGEPLPLEKNARLLRHGLFSKMLADNGHQVTWWSSTFSHALKKQVVFHDQDIVFNNLTLRLLHGPGYDKNISYKRIKHIKHFALRFSKLAPNYSLPDLIISTIPTVETSYAAIAFAKNNNVPIFVDIRDQWPDELTDLAPRLIKPLAKLLLRSSYKKMHWVCQQANGIMGVSSNEIDYGLRFAQRQLREDDCVFPLGYLRSHIEEIKIQEALKWCQKIGIKQNNFIICFFGTIGQYFDLGTVIKAAKILAERYPVQFVLAGNGSQKSKFEKLADGHSAILFPGWLDAPKIAAVMRLSKVGLAPYRLEAKMSMSNKPFEYMAGGLAIVSSIQGELKGVLEKHVCGFTYKANSINDLINALLALIENESMCRMMGENARKLLEEQYAVEKVFKNVSDHLICSVERYSSGRPNVKLNEQN